MQRGQTALRASACLPSRSGVGTEGAVVGVATRHPARVPPRRHKYRYPTKLCARGLLSKMPQTRARGAAACAWFRPFEPPQRPSLGERARLPASERWTIVARMHAYF